MRIKFLLVLAAIAATASTAAAQQRQLPAELGMDAGVSVGFDTPRVTVIQIPIPAIRLGVYLTDRVSVEPRFGFQSFHDNNGTSSAYTGEVGVLFHFEDNPIGRGAYARPFAGLVGSRIEGSSDTQTFFGGGLGVKEPFASRFASRLEVNYSHMTAPKGGSTSNSLGILFGISVFNR